LVSTENDTPSESPDPELVEQPEADPVRRLRSVRDVIRHGEKRGGQARAVGGRVPGPVSERPAAPPGSAAADQQPPTDDDGPSVTADGQGG
jgi:hypothetical protein